MPKFSTKISYRERVLDSKAAFTQPVSNYFQDSSVPYTLRSLLPGHVYTFEYLDDVDERDIISIPDYIKTPAQKKTEKANGIRQQSYIIDKPYYDLRPIGLAITGINTDNQTEYILNLKCMPREDRSLVLELLYRGVIPSLLKTAIETEEEKKGELMQFDKRIKNGSYVLPFLRIKMEPFVNVLGPELYFWINKYDKNRIRNIRLIDFDQLEKLAGLEYPDDPFTRFNQTSLREVQSLYQSYVKNKA